MKTPKYIFACLFLLFVMTFVMCFCTTTTAYADDGQSPITIPVPVVSAEPDPGAVMTPLMKGQKAPYTGTLLSPRSVAIFIAEVNAMPQKCQFNIDAALARCQADSDFEVGMCRTKSESDTAVLNSKLKLLEAVDTQNKKRIQELEKVQTSPVTWLLLGAAGGVVVTGAIVYISHR